MPKISVLMSCFNASQYISEAIESILNQTYTDYEFIIVNDGSTDDTLDIIKKYASQDRRIVIVDKENTGLADSLNRGLDIAEGKWIARLDADDIALPQRLTAQIEFAESNRIDVLGSGCVTIDYFGRELSRHKYPLAHDRLIRQIEKCGSPFPHSSVLFKRKKVLRVGGYRNRLNGAEDVDLWLRMSSENKLACVNKVLIKLRKHEESITGDQDISKIMRISILSIVARVCHFLRIKKLPDPSQADDIVWNEFIGWLTEQVELRHYCEDRRQWANMRQDYLSSDKTVCKLQGSLKLSGKLLVSGQTFSIVRDKLFGSNLVSQMAEGWVKVSANRIQKC